MEGAEDILIGACDEILRRTLTFCRRMNSGGLVRTQDAHVSKNAAYSSALPGQERGLLILLCLTNKHCTASG